MTQQPTRPVFRKPDSTDFYKALVREVHERVLTDDGPRRQNVIKACLLLLLYVACYTGILLAADSTAWLFTFYALTGIAMMTLFINAFHDSVHGALFRSPRYNESFSQVLFAFGSSPWLWKRRHIGLHHQYPSIQHWDVDIKQSDIIRIFPESRWFAFHRYQHLYMWFIYPFYSLNWIFIRDFKDFFGTADNYVRRVTQIPPREYMILFASKLFNLLYLIAIPLAVLDQPWYLIIAGYLMMHVAGSIVGVVALISTHVDEEAVFPLPPADGKMDATWAEHQLRVTKDFSTDSRLANFLYGGFTHHVAHHLFPNVPHTYYPKITPIIKRYALEQGLKYTDYPFHKAVTSHFRLLKRTGTPQAIFVYGDL